MGFLRIDPISSLTLTLLYYSHSFQMVLPNLTTNTFYEVKVRAASISTINPRQVILGSYSEPQKVLETFQFNTFLI